MACVIKLIWSEEEKFWHSKSMDERFGLTLESGSLDALIERVKTALPELLEAIGYTGEIALSFELERMDRLQVTVDGSITKRTSANETLKDAGITQRV